MGRAAGPLRPADAGAPAAHLLDIRNALPGDADDVAALLGHLGYPCTPADAGERIHAMSADTFQVLLLARQQGRACGLLGLDFLYYLPLGATICRITALVVDPDSQRRGIGRQLLDDAMQRARHAGCVRLELTTALHRTEAHAFYRACGFAETSLRFSRALGAA
jgi:GNAT superfamily N-acetyltransferase